MIRHSSHWRFQLRTAVAAALVSGTTLGVSPPVSAETPVPGQVDTPLGRTMKTELDCDEEFRVIHPAVRLSGRTRCTGDLMAVSVRLSAPSQWCGRVSLRSHRSYWISRWVCDSKLSFHKYIQAQRVVIDFDTRRQ